MDEIYDSLDWREFMMSPPEELPGSISEPYFMTPVSHGDSLDVFMSKSEAKANLGENGFRVDNVIVKNEEMILEKFSYNDASPLDSSGSRSPCLTIPCGISPNELLDSPVMLHNSQLSPTTGTLDLSPPEHDNSMLRSTSVSADREQDGDDVSSFGLKPPLPYYPSSQNQNYQAEGDGQSLAHFQSLEDFEYLVQQENPGLSSGLELAADATIPFGITTTNESTSFQLSSHSYGVADSEMRESNETTQVANTVGRQSLDVLQKRLYPSGTTTKTSEDGYNWRKYGQKQVKGSDYPRSYYKCTHPSCQVKKKVERSHDGEITEIIYKGGHNHPKSQPSRRLTPGESTDIGECNRSYVMADPLWREMQQVGSVGMDITSSTSVVTELSDPHSNNQKPMDVLESAETPELTSTLASHDEEEEDTTTQGSLSVGDDDDIETESKRRKKESSMIETAMGSRAIREPRVIVQIESEIDIIDDGYRWRKYGQKVVKGNPNPRSYYKCTSAGCVVRKHVERASHNLKYVLTTYEGKHNHVVPAARNSNHINSGNPNLPPSSSSQSNVTLPRNSHLPKPEPQDFIPPFHRKIGYESEFLRPDYLGNFTGASSSLYHHMKFPTLSSSGLYGNFGLNPNNYMSSTPLMIPNVRNLPMPLPLNFPLPSNFAMANYSQGRQSLNPVPPFFMGQQMNDNDVKLIRPKQEQRD